MGITAIANFFDDTEKQCEEWLGRTNYFIMMDNIYTRNQRLGQAFFNALPKSDQEKLRGADADPFYRENWVGIQRALDFLLEH